MSRSADTSPELFAANLRAPFANVILFYPPATFRPLYENPHAHPRLRALGARASAPRAAAG